MLVETDLRDGVYRITLNDPRRRNPLSEEMLADLRTAVGEAAKNVRVRSVVLTGYGSGFCSGGDLASLDALTPAQVARFMSESQSVVQAITSLSVPVVAAINGAAAGAGFSLAMAADILIAAQSASFVPAFSRVGAVPDLGLIHALYRTIGLHRTTDILLRGTSMDALEAQQLGIVSETVPDKDLLARSSAVARQLAEGPTVSLGLTKRLIRNVADGSLAGFLAAEAASQGVAFSTLDFIEGVAAARSHRPPKFEGR